MLGIANINREHPDFVFRKAMWEQYEDLYAGGEQLRSRATQYLVRRHKEPGDVYLERLNRVFYENYLESDHRLVCGDVDAAGTGAAVRGWRYRG